MSTLAHLSGIYLLRDLYVSVRAYSSSVQIFLAPHVSLSLLFNHSCLIELWSARGLPLEFLLCRFIGDKVWFYHLKMSLFIWLYCSAFRILVPRPGTEPGPWQWKPKHWTPTLTFLKHTSLSLVFPFAPEFISHFFKGKCPPPLFWPALKIFLIVFCFLQFHYIVDFHVFILLDICMVCWICGLKFFSVSRKFSGIIPHKTDSSLFSPVLRGLQVNKG